MSVPVQNRPPASEADQIIVLRAKLKTCNHRGAHQLAAIRRAVQVLTAYETMSGEDAHQAPCSVRRNLDRAVETDRG